MAVFRDCLSVYLPQTSSFIPYNDTYIRDDAMVILENTFVNFYCRVFFSPFIQNYCLVVLEDIKVKWSTGK